MRAEALSPTGIVRQIWVWQPAIDIPGRTSAVPSPHRGPGDSQWHGIDRTSAAGTQRGPWGVQFGPDQGTRENTVLTSGTREYTVGTRSGPAGGVVNCSLAVIRPAVPPQLQVRVGSGLFTAWGAVPTRGGGRWGPAAWTRAVLEGVLGDRRHSTFQTQVSE